MCVMCLGCCGWGQVCLPAFQPSDRIGRVGMWSLRLCSYTQATHSVRWFSIKCCFLLCCAGADGHVHDSSAQCSPRGPCDATMPVSAGQGYQHRHTLTATLTSTLTLTSTRHQRPTTISISKHRKQRPKQEGTTDQQQRVQPGAGFACPWSRVEVSKGLGRGVRVRVRSLRARERI